jgi:hypothetical protein
MKFSKIKENWSSMSHVPYDKYQKHESYYKKQDKL